MSAWDGDDWAWFVVCFLLGAGIFAVGISG